MDGRIRFEFRMQSEAFRFELDELAQAKFK